MASPQLGRRPSTTKTHISELAIALFAERGFDKAKVWLSATRDAIEACECEAGCPSCVQSPKCGNKNNPLDKAAAITLIDVLVKDASEATFVAL